MQEACKTLAIDNATLYRWLRRADNITPLHSPEDNRVRLLTEDDVKYLASTHRKKKTRSKPAKTVQDTLHQRIDALEHENALLRTRLDALEQTTRPVRPAKVASHTTASTDDNTPISDNVPPDALSLNEFTKLHGLDRRKVLDHLLRYDMPHIARPIDKRPGQYERYFSPEQQKDILAYWQRKK